MGLDISAQLIVGVHLKHMIVPFMKTQYDINTGIPNQVKIERERFVIDGYDIEVNIDDEEILDFIICSDSEDKDSYFLAASIANTYSKRIQSPWAIVPDCKTESIEKITKILKKKFNYTGAIHEFVVAVLSY